MMLEGDFLFLCPSSTLIRLTEMVTVNKASTLKAIRSKVSRAENYMNSFINSTQ